MDDFISRESILEKLKAKFCAYCPLQDCDANCKLHYLLDAVKEAPAADVRPVVRGEWQEIPLLDDMQMKVYTCSRCNRSIKIPCSWRIQETAPFCHCGADMREDER